MQCQFVFSTSWEVCNKVGGIYTVLSTQAKSLQSLLQDHLVFIGPDLGQNAGNSAFHENKNLLAEWKTCTQDMGIEVRMGRWDIPGKPIVALVKASFSKEQKNRIYSKAWEDYHVNSLHAYGDYDEACLFSWTAGVWAAEVYRNFLDNCKAVFQAHEWMSGMGLLYIKKNCPGMGTVFTTHATSIGRSIVSNNKNLYEFFPGYNGDQMAVELNMEAKHSIEKQAAKNADCMTTVSELTNRECKQLLERDCDVILPNGFESDFVPKGAVFQSKRKKSRQKMLETAGKLLGKKLSDNTVIIGTSGRNDFRCKGMDILIDCLSRLQKQNLKKDVLAVIAVPCWKKGPRKDLLDATTGPLPEAFITHELYNFDSDAIVGTIKWRGITWTGKEKLHLLFVPSYLDGNDGVLDLPYYDWLTGCDLCLYPSYYEPWGYTPAESIAFGIPCLTTDLAGVGVWINDTLGHKALLKEDGVEVIHRTDSNYEDAAQHICKTVKDFLTLTPEEILNLKKSLQQLTKEMAWQRFILNYEHAFDFALKKNNK